jgi:Transposase DDE domain
VEYQLWAAIIAVVRRLDRTPRPTRHHFRDADVVGVYYWAVVHDRPVAWACRRANWPIHRRRAVLPSEATLSRRLGTPSVRALLAELERRVVAPTAAGVFWLVDGKPLVVGGASGDRQAACGRAVGGLARGYKLHAIVNPLGQVAACEVTAMNVDERTVAARLIPRAGIGGYLLADGNYDSNRLHAVCDGPGGLQLLTPRRYRAAAGLGHHRHSAGRRRCVELWSRPGGEYIRGLLRERGRIERTFANLTNWGGGLGPLPAWVRGLKRVDRWVRAKLVLNAAKRQDRTHTCDN